jgi:membrane fusion protein (multidrug efflux system)
MSEQELNQTTTATPAAVAGEIAKRPSRHWSLVLLLGAGALASVGYAVDYWFEGRYHVATDDAYVNGNLVRLAPQVSGTVVSINTDETQFVEQGQLLVQLDSHDAEIALARANATLAETVREVAQLFDNARRDQATVEAQQSLLGKSTQDLTRDRSLAPVHGVSLETLEHDSQAVRNSQATLAQAQATLAATRAAITGTTPETHPRVLEAESNLRAAWLAYTRTRVLAPISGYVVRRAVQLGQQVAPGSEMLAIVPVDSVWIDANFKETQLADLRIGQPVTVHADMYGSQGEYHGKVLGVTAGTGSALSVLPAQNASGNWIKIVQRLPVRVGLDPRELAAHPLLLGVSTRIDIDTRNRQGATLSKQPAWQPTMTTDAYATQDAGVESSIAAIVSGNLPPARQSLAHDHSHNLSQTRSGAALAANRSAP